MKYIHVLAFLFLGVWLLLTGFFALAGVVVTPVFATIMHVLALLSGLFFLVSVSKSCCSHDNGHCCDMKHKDDGMK